MSLKLVPFESFDAVSYSLSIVTMAVSVAVCEIFNVKEWGDLVTMTLSCTIFELFDVEQYRDPKIWVRGHSR